MIGHSLELFIAVQHFSWHAISHQACRHLGRECTRGDAPYLEVCHNHIKYLTHPSYFIDLDWGDLWSDLVEGFPGLQVGSVQETLSGT